MESISSVEKELDKVLYKFGGIQDLSKKTLTQLIEYVQAIRQDLLEAPPDSDVPTTQALILTQCIKKIRDTVSCQAVEHRDLHSTVSKVGKAIDRNFTADFSAASNISCFHGLQEHSLLNSVICEHFYRNGMLDIAEALTKEASLKINDDKKAPFFELNSILDALMHKNLMPALQWVEKHREHLKAQNSQLEFKLHRLQFIELIRQGSIKQNDAIQYARNSFQTLSINHVKEVQVLMGSLLYIHQDLANSPYSYLLDNANWTEICEVFTRDACALLGLSVDSPLAVCINAGCRALPALLNIKQVMLQRQVTGVWSSKDELPIEVDLGKESRYHSVFACPILRQQSTEANPPMRLVCGHVISRDALNKLASGSKLKCPYCPVDQSPSDARQVHF